MSKQLDQVIVSDSNRTPVIQIVVWFCLATGTLATIIHAGVKLFASRAIKAESVFLLISLVFCIAQSAAVLIQCEYGFGKPASILSSVNIQPILKAEYAATMLLFMSVGTSKLAIIAFLDNLDPLRLRRKLNYSVGALVCSWMFCALLVAVFQCEIPRPWDRTLHERCLDRFVLWNAILSLNIVAELAIIALELEIMARLRVAFTRKLSMISVFACRLLVPVASAIQLVFFHKEVRSAATNRDLTLGYWQSTLCNEVVQCLSIVTICIPYTKIFMAGFESGVTRVDAERQPERYISKEDS